ncbi:hypothetical protein [Streptomyces sp. NL15-2K]|uniref:hypothetical protein n=1 Tax=Streptomyces sp. NL15-2K TaxID=376149 RepID=UPI00155A535D|nr:MULTISPECIES: hypothetical protein [Actinomycetes]WKX13587.1 hypothetical protein Q4V64_41095 [Kutzneria buriramensis]
MAAEVSPHAAQAIDGIGASGALSNAPGAAIAVCTGGAGQSWSSSAVRRPPTGAK